MCGLIALAFLGFFGIFGIGAISGPQIGTVGVTSVPFTAMEMTPTPTFVPADAPPVSVTAVPTAEGIASLSCESVYTPEEDAAFVAEYPEDTFDTQWTFTPGTGILKTTGTWTNDDLSAVAFMELLQYDCGVPPMAVEAYFNADTFPIFFQYYDSYTPAQVCNSIFETLYTFHLVFYEQPYEAHYWFEQVSPTRLALFSVTLPASEVKGMDQIARRLFPNLPECLIIDAVG